jgi:hypothetical protein
MATSSSYPYYTTKYKSPYLFGAQTLFNLPEFLNKNYLGQIKISIENNRLLISPFYIIKYGLKYINPKELSIDLSQIENNIYQIIAVHNFQVEDRNPNIGECILGIFLARNINGKFEEAEEYPMECRTIKKLGHIDTHKNIFYD